MKVQEKTYTREEDVVSEVESIQEMYPKKESKGKKILKSIVRNLDIRDWLVPENKKWLAIATAYFIAFTPASAPDAKKSETLVRRVTVTNQLTYENLSEDYLAKQYDKSGKMTLYTINDDAIEVNKSVKDYFKYPDRSEVAIGEDNTVIRWDKYGKATTYRLAPYSHLYTDDTGLIVWQSDIKSALPSGGVYRVIMPDGLLIEKEFIEYNDSSMRYTYKLSVGGSKIPYLGSLYNGFYNPQNDVTSGRIKFPWNKDGNRMGTVEYVREESIGTYGPHFGVEFGINWYDTSGKLVQTLDLGTDSHNRYLGTITYLDKGLAKCTWNDGTEVIYETEENIIQSCKYPNGVEVNLTSESVIIEDNGEKMLIGLKQPAEELPGCNLKIELADGQIMTIIDGIKTMERIDYNRAINIGK